jgi:hypothetical protein
MTYSAVWSAACACGHLYRLIAAVMLPVQPQGATAPYTTPTKHPELALGLFLLWRRVMPFCETMASLCFPTSTQTVEV